MEMEVGSKTTTTRKESLGSILMNFAEILKKLKKGKGIKKRKGQKQRLKRKKREEDQKENAKRRKKENKII